MKVGIYPGTFDPITKGHLDIIQRSYKLVDKLIIAISKNNEKKTLFSVNDRIEMVKNVINETNLKNITVDSFKGLLMNYANKQEANVIFRGLRAVSDFEYEFQMTGMNYKLNPDIETVFLMASDKHQLISSKLVKEVCRLKGDISQFVSKEIEERLKKKMK